MGHYDSYYEETATEMERERTKRNKAVKRSLEGAMQNAWPANKEMFRVKIQEALFWLEHE